MSEIGLMFALCLVHFNQRKDFLCSRACFPEVEGSTAVHGGHRSKVLYLGQGNTCLFYLWWNHFSPCSRMCVDKGIIKFGGEQTTKFLVITMRNIFLWVNSLCSNWLCFCHCLARFQAILPKGCNGMIKRWNCIKLQEILKRLTY